MKLSAVILLCACLSSYATTFTEWYAIKGTGTNLNSGSTQDANATFTAASGNWTNSTGTFFKTALNPVSGGVTNGAWASVYADATTTNTWFVGMVTNADDTADTIQLSQVAFMGVNPANRIGDCTIKVGGAWDGPNTNTMAAGGGFPFAFLANTATNSSLNIPRCNFKSGTTYGISNAITHALAGPMRFQGYTTTPGDGGRALIDGGTIKPGYTLLLITGSTIDLADFIFSNNGASGSGSLVQTGTGARHFIWRCVFHDSRGAGLYAGSSGAYVLECEAYNCEKDNAANIGAFRSDVAVTYNRCFAHDNTTGVNSHGFGTSISSIINCIGESNSGHGIQQNGPGTSVIIGSVLYNNTLSGFDGTTTASSYCFENCVFAKNGAFGINSSGNAIRTGQILNCAFGTGTMTNASGSFAANASVVDTNSIILLAADTTPWVDPANGDFRINLSAVKSVGRGSFTQTASSYSGTVAYPDIGAAQSADTNATTRAFGFSQ